MLAVFSIVDGKPRLLDRYWDRYDCCAIDESGLLYIYCYYDSAEDWYYTIEQLSDYGNELLPIERYGMETYDYDTGEHYSVAHYYKLNGEKSYSEREIISESEYGSFLDRYPVFTDWERVKEITDNSGIAFIPILD